MKKTSNVVLALVSFSLFFGLSNPLLFSAQVGAFSFGTRVLFDTVVSRDGTLHTTILTSSPSVPINALYLHILYDASLTCEYLKSDEENFPLILESDIDAKENTTTLAVASLGYGVTATTTVATLTCHTNNTTSSTTKYFMVHEDSRAYAADGLGSELLVNR